MTTASTAFVFVGPSGVGSFHDRLWRVNPNSAQLVEGGTNGPYFLLGNRDEEFIFHVEHTDSDSVVRAIVLLATLLVAEEKTLGMLRASENLIQTDRGERVAPYWEIADDVLAYLVKQLSPLCRLGFVRLEPNSLITSDVIEALGTLGLDCSAFEDMESLQSSHHS